MKIVLTFAYEGESSDDDTVLIVDGDPPTIRNPNWDAPIAAGTSKRIPVPVPDGMPDMDLIISVEP